MTPHDDKRELRRLKRTIKRAGNKRRRQALKKDLEHNPEEAAHSEFDYGRLSSETLNGLDNAPPRQQDEG